LRRVEPAPHGLRGLCDNERPPSNDGRLEVFDAARSAACLVRTLLLSTRSSQHGRLPLLRLEFVMTKKIQQPLPTPVPGRPPTPQSPALRAPPAEPLEVLGRHKNTGQKDHKGAR
jgi:hypothetical protein